MKRIELVGNADLKKAVSSMLASDKLSHSIVITGDKGMGKKTAARYIGASVLCENPVDGKPCMSCRSCMMIEHGGHPDFIEVRPSGKNGIYRMESDLRPVISDACIKPSEAKYKIVVIADMDATAQNSQNVLLKLVEEPPQHLIVIMTACSREYFLPTILSRVTKLSVSPLEKDELFYVLEENCQQKDSEKFRKAYEALGANAGKCIQFVDGKELALAVEITAQVCAAAAEKDEYALMKAFFRTDGDKKIFTEVLMLFSKALRDCAVKRSSGASLVMLSCCSEETARLSKKLGVSKSIELFSLCEKYIAGINGNVNVNLALSSVCAEIMEIL